MENIYIIESTNFPFINFSKELRGHIKGRQNGLHMYDDT